MINNTENAFLTKEKKEYYMRDFQKVLTYKGIDFWDLDEGISDILIKINNNPNLQTLYSKKFELNKGSTGFRKSYLQICYLCHLKDKLLTALKEIQQLLQDEVKIFDEPSCHENTNKTSESTLGLGCFDDKEYFNICSYKIILQSYNINSHNTFWNLLELKLQNL